MYQSLWTKYDHITDQATHHILAHVGLKKNRAIFGL